MNLGYLDESYNAEFYWLTGLLIPDTGLVSLQKQLDDVVRRTATKFPELDPRAELHGYDLVQGQSDWSPLKKQVRVRIGVYQAALEAIASIPDAIVYLRGVDRKRLVRRYAHPWHPHRVTLGHLAQIMNTTTRLRAAGCTLLIADEVSETESLREHLWEFQNNGTMSVFNNHPLDHVADTIYFAPSKHSRLLQAADLVSYLHFRMRHSGVSDPRAQKANEDLWNLIKPKCDVGLWTP